MPSIHVYTCTVILCLVWVHIHNPMPSTCTVHVHNPMPSICTCT